uniref:RNA replication protein n=1 Tax=Adenium obesum virus X TaxID=3074438 RepID=A0AA51Z3H4_9VIRU|nr:RNA-dependent RNA polymerase [Adenium obesum virus X]
MALVSKVLANVTDASVRAVVQEEAYKTIRPILKQAQLVNPYAIPEAAADDLEKLGIITNPYSIALHTHAGVKAIENKLLGIVGEYLPQRERTTFLYLKRSKLRFLRRDPRLKDYFMNQMITPRDAARYSEDTLIKEDLQIPTTTAYISDTLHFLSPEYLIRLFEASPALDVLYATLVLPPEALYRMQSLYPNLYTLNYSQYGGYQYLPGGCGGAAYHHEMKTLDWLKYDHIISPNVTITAEIVESLAANHLYIFKRGKMFTPPIRTFRADEMVLLPQIFHPSEYNAVKPISKTLAMQLLLYCKSLKTVTERDIYAKIRQLIPTNQLANFSQDEIIHMANYFSFMAELDSTNSFDKILSMSCFKKFLMPIKNKFIVWYEKIFGQRDFLQLMKALEWKTFSHSIKTEQYSVTFKENSKELWTKASLPEIEPSEEDLSDPTQLSESQLQNVNTEPLPTQPAGSLTPKALPAPPTPPGFNIPTDTQTTPDFINTCLQPVKTFKCLCQAPTTILHHTKLAYAHEAANLLHLDQVKTHTTSPIPNNQKLFAPGFDPVGGAFIFTNVPAVLKVQCYRGQTNIDLDPGQTAQIHDFFLQGHDLSIETLLPGTVTTFTSLDPKMLVHKLQDALLQANNSSHPPTTDTPSTSSQPNLGECSTPSTTKVTTIPPSQNSPTLASVTTPLPHPSNKPLQINEPQPDPMTNHSHTEPQPIGKGKEKVDCPEPSKAEKMMTKMGYTPGEGLGKQHQGVLTEPKIEIIPKRAGLGSASPKPSAPEDLGIEIPWKSWLPILNSVGFKGNQMQYSDHKRTNLIIPITRQHKLPRSEGLEDLDPNLILALKSISRFPTPVLLSGTRAAAYASDLKNCRTGLLGKTQPLEWKQKFSLMCERSPDMTVQMSVIHGAGGSGKSRFLQNWLKTFEQDNCPATIVVPTNELRLDWEGKLPNINRLLIKTFEKALIAGSGQIVIFDDYGKMPAGFIEAYIFSHPAVELAILTGDPRQSSYHEDNDMALISKLDPGPSHFDQYSRYYLNCTHRNRRDIANKLGVYSETEGPCSITISSQVLKGIPILTPSMIKKTAITELGNKGYTYAGCQGLTAPKVQILLDSNTPFCSDEVMYTALSRSVEMIHFINTGPNSQEYWTKLDATPYLKTFLDTAREEAMAKITSLEPQVPEPKIPTHFPVEHQDIQLEDYIEGQKEKYDREIFDSRHGHTNCIQTDDQLVQIFQHQQAKDEPLLWATIEARIKTASPEQNLKELALKKDIGDLLFLNYKRAMHLPDQPVPFDPRLWELSATEVRNKYLEKPINMLVNAAQRQSPDFDKEKIALFLKSQWVKKVEKLGALKVKPGQTIAAFMQETVMLYGTMARYLRKMRAVFQPKNIFINCEKTPEDLNQFVLENWNFSRTAYSNDFTAFDQSQDGAMLQFEVLKAKHFNIPADIIDGYVHLKTHATIFLGTLAIMRLTGEGPTFDANTECSIAYHHTRFHVPDNVAQLYAGDDSAQDHPAIEKKSFQLIQNKLNLTSKPVTYQQKPGDWADFCGWTISRLGIFKNPTKILASLELAIKTGKTKEVATSYALDAKFAYQLGDKLQEVLSEKECGMHQTLIRKIHKIGTGHLLEGLS